MDRIQTFGTRKEAEAALAEIKGWDAKVGQLFMPADANANRSGNVFVIVVSGHGDPRYLREGGYVS